jgi:hypothetical protein
MKDQNATVHVYLYDLLGRQLEDQVTVLGTGIDGSVRRITTAYEVRGFVQTITSYNCLPASSSSSSSSSSSGSGGVVNQVQFVYNSFGQLVTDYQEHGGAVNTSTSLNVQYGYADGSAGTTGSRRSPIPTAASSSTATTPAPTTPSTGSATWKTRADPAPASNWPPTRTWASAASSR